MKNPINKELIFSVLILILGLSFVYFFTSIVLYMIIAAIVALIGKPLKLLVLKIKIKQRHLSNNLASAITLLALFTSFIGLFVLVIPAIANQASDLMSLDFNEIARNINQSLVSTETLLKDYGALKESESLALIIQNYLTTLVSDIQLNSVASSAFGMLGDLFMGFFSVLFISYFFLRDEDLFQDIILLFIPEKNKKNVQHALLKIKQLLSRYFVGLTTEVGTMMILESIGGLIIGLPNAILIGFLGGLLNIIPYIGPMIGGLVAVLLVLISNITMGIDATLPLIYGIIIVFAIANLIDNFVLQPIIYSNSVKAHPLEIFIVIIVGGNLYGPTGMIAAIPVYTIIRVMAKEFLSELDIVKKVTKSI